MKIKEIVRKLHLWIGLAIGILFFLIAFSGAIYTWEPEFSRIIYKESIQPQNAPFVSVSELYQISLKEFPKYDFRTILYRDKSSTIQVLLYSPGTYYLAQFNPYTGKLIHIQDMKKGWLNYVKSMHRNLLLGKTGQEIVHWVTLLSLAMLITGIVIWWPKNKRTLNKALKIKWNASPRKLNYDLHNILGFYASWIIVFCIVTGIFWGFEWVKSTFKLATGENQIKYEIPESATSSIPKELTQFSILDSLAWNYQEKFPSKYINISKPHENTESIILTIIGSNGGPTQIDNLYFDQNTGKRISGNFENGMQNESSTYQSINQMVYDIHMGNIFGFPSRLLVFFASLIAASLPITGFMIWLAKNRK